MNDASYFDRLVETTSLIVRHPDYPGKPEALDLCGQEIEELIESGRITASQADLLRDILGIIRYEGRFRSNGPGKSELTARARAPLPI
jgi:hypothetical protein